MRRYPVTVTASYDAGEAPQGTRERLRAWAAGADGRTFVVDDSIAPERWTVTVDYQLEAPDEPAAERSAVDQFTAEASQAGITPPETVLAATGPLR